MTNHDVLKEYNTEQWVIEQTLCFMLQEYAEKLGVKNPYNPVTFVKEFMKQETYADIALAEKSKMDTVASSVVADASSIIVEEN